jgi:hypothetical protein
MRQFGQTHILSPAFFQETFPTSRCNHRLLALVEKFNRNNYLLFCSLFKRKALNPPWNNFSASTPQKDTGTGHKRRFL